MRPLAPKARADLEYSALEVDGDEMVLVRDPVRNTYFRFNLLQGAMLRSLDGRRTTAEITAVLSEQYDVEIPRASAERFIAHARDLMLLEITAYRTTSAAARTQVRKALRKAGFHRRSPARRRRLASPSSETATFATALDHLDRDHPRAAAGYLAGILDQNPGNAPAKQLYELVQTAYLRAAGKTTDFPVWVLFNPSRLLTWMSRTFGRFLFSWVGVLGLLVFFCIGAQAYANVPFEHLEIGPTDILVLLAIKSVSGLFHELGHGLACQHYGGNVTEIGFTLFYYVQPAFYCDTSSSYQIAVRRHRMIVQLAGVAASLTWMSGMAIFLTILRPSVPVYSGLLLGLLLASVLVFVNLVPFLKFDGYYMLCEYSGFPNLRDRSFKLARAWLSQRLLGIELPVEELPPRTRRRLIAFAVASFAVTSWFMYLGYFRVLAPLIERFRTPALVLAIALTAYLLRNVTLRPAVRLVRLLVRERRRIFTPRRTAMMVLVGAIAFGPWFVQWPVLVDADAVVVPRQRADVRAQVGGRVEEIFVREGDHVRRGQPLARLRAPALRARIEAVTAELLVASHRLEQLRRGPRAEELALARSHLELASAEARRTQGDAAVASRLAEAALGTRSSADAAVGRAAVSGAEVSAARWALSLVEAGARPEAIAAADAERARLEGELAHLRTNESLLTLRSPCDGVIATPRVEDLLHATLAPGDRFAEVHDLGEVVMEIALSKRDPLGEIAVGDEVEIRLRGAPHDGHRVRVARFRDAVQEPGGEERIIAVTEPFALEQPISGLAGHARIYGAERSLAYAYFYLPMRRLISVRLWSL